MKPRKMRRHVGTLTAMALFGAAAACAQPVTLVDQNRRSIVLAKPAERVVTIPWPFAAMLMAVDGGSGRLVGMNPGSMAALERGS